MAQSVDAFLTSFGLQSLGDENLSAEARIDRAVFWPAFGPYLAITVRDLGGLGEVEIVALLRSEFFRYRHLGPPDRWTEVQMIGVEDLRRFRLVMDEIQAAKLENGTFPCYARDGIHFKGEVRRPDAHKWFQVEGCHELWQSHPNHQRFFRSFWELAREVMVEDWSQRALDPRHFGDLLASEIAPEASRPRTKRRRF